MTQKKLESTLINMVLVLTSISLLSALSLGFAYQQTKGEIEKAQENKKLAAISDVVLEGFDNRPDKTVQEIADDSGVALTIYTAEKNGITTSYAVRSYSKKAFGGEMWLMVGFTADGKINKISVLDQKETPGLGTKVDEASFKNQFFGKNPASFNLKVKKDGGDIDAITAATISSRAYSDAVERAYSVLQKVMSKTNQEGNL